MTNKFIIALLFLCLKCGCSIATASSALIPFTQMQDTPDFNSKIYSQELCKSLNKIKDEAYLLTQLLTDYQDELTEFLVNPLPNDKGNMAALKNAFLLFDQFHQLRTTRYLELVTGYKGFLTCVIDLSIHYKEEIQLLDLLAVYRTFGQLQSLFDVIGIEHQAIIDNNLKVKKFVISYHDLLKIEG